jgi:hypothetical protein
MLLIPVPPLPGMHRYVNQAFSLPEKLASNPG